MISLKKITLGLFVSGALVGIGVVLAVLMFAAGRGDRTVERLQQKFFPDGPVTDAQGWSSLPTALHAVEWRQESLTEAPETGGALTHHADVGILSASAKGDFYLSDGDGASTRLDLPTPLNLIELESDPAFGLPNFHDQFFRINDILLVPSRDDSGSFDLYSTHHFFDAGRTCVEFRLSRLPVTLVDGVLNAEGATWETMMKAEPCIPVEEGDNPTYFAFNGDVSGGRMLLWDAETLMVSVGDFQLFEKSGLALAQDAASHLGKILLVDRTTGESTVYASGMRNPQGLWRDEEGRLWETEHGPRGGDELNLIELGADYGWPTNSYGIHYDLRPWGPNVVEGSHEVGTVPKMAFVPSLGISVVVQPGRRQFPNWNGDLMIGTLSTQKLMRIRMDGDRMVYAEPIAMPGFRIRDLDVLPDGSLIGLSNRMELLFLRNADGAGSAAIATGTPDAGEIDSLLAALSEERAALVKTGIGEFQENCTKCHGIGGAVSSGPSLSGVTDRPIASYAGYTYSPALSAVRGRWSEASLLDYLESPDAFAPGQGMPAPEIDAGEREAIVAYLIETQRTANDRERTD